MDFPYRLRPGQAEMIGAIESVQSDGGQLLLEAGTGSGKTITALTASLASTKRDGRRVLYATRTNSQQAHVISEHAVLQDAGAEPGLLVPFMGRKHYCPLLRSDERFKDGTSEELGRLCRDAKKKATEQHQTGRPIPGACPFYARLLADGVGPVESLLSKGGLSAADLGQRIERAGSCPYEALKLLMPKAHTVVVPLVFILDDKLRQTLLQWMGTTAPEVHLVLDEAHHVPDAAREHWSPTLSAESLHRAQKEAEEYHDPVLAGTTLSTSLLDALSRILFGLANEHVRGDADSDGLVPPGALSEALMVQLRMPSSHIGRLAHDLERWGETIREDRRAKGRLPRSYLGSIGSFLQTWLAAETESYVHLVSGRENPKLELYLLDPAPVLSFLGEFWSAVHMSGTLAPLEDYRIVCGIGQAKKLEMPSPFPAENLRIFAIEGVDRRFEAIQRDPSLVSKQQDLARQAIQASPGRTGLFFPSHKMLDDYVAEGFLFGVARSVFVERPGMSMAELQRLVDSFRREPTGSALLLAVLGGRITEGLDFPGDMLEHVLIFGIPYPKPSARSQALIHHYDRVAGNGWTLAVHNPVGRVLRQAIGRLIRGPTDRGTAIILDDRAVRFHSHLKSLKMVPDVASVTVATGGKSEPDGYQTAHQLTRKATPGN